MTYNRSPYNLNDDNIVSIVDELSVWSAPFGLKLLDTILLKKNISVLDIGFGPGFPLIEVALRLGTSCRIYGIDPWKAAAARAKKKIDIFGLKNVELIDGCAEHIPLPDSSIDLIVSNNGINNVQEIDKVFAECSRVARPGAQFVASVNLQETMEEFYQIFEAVLSDLRLNDVIPKLHQHIYLKRRPLEELTNLFTDHQFQILDVVRDSFRFRYADGTSMLNHPFIRYAFMDSWIDLVPSGRVNAVFSEIENRMNKIAEGKGEWDVTIPFVVIDSRKS